MRRGRTPPLRKRCKGCGEREIPRHGVAVPAPFRQGGRGDGGCGLPRAWRTLAMTLLLQEGRYGIGGRTEASAPYGSATRGAGEREIPRHGVAVPAPFRQGGRGDGGCGLPRAWRTLAMTLLLQEGRYGIGGRTEASAPTEALQGVRCKAESPPSRRCRDCSPCAGEAFLYRKNDRPGGTVVFY